MMLAEKYHDLDIWYASDYSQLEIRVLAQMSQDPLLVKLLQSGEDIHSSVGHELTGIPVVQIKDNRDIRTTVKGIHFGIIYGLSAQSLFFKLKLDAAERKEPFKMKESEVVKLYNRYFERFQGVKEFIDQQIRFAQKYGYVETMFGFRREISEYGDEDRGTFWKNQSINSPIQGTAHQLITIALALLQLKQQTYKLLLRLSMEIHDSLVAYCQLQNLPETHRVMLDLLERDVLVYVKEHWPKITWRVPLKAEGKAGFRLGVLEKYEGEPSAEFLERWCMKNKEFEDKLALEMKA